MNLVFILLEYARMRFDLRLDHGIFPWLDSCLSPNFLLL